MTAARRGPERALLVSFLDQQRDSLLWKLDGLSADELRTRALPRSQLHLLGLLKHMAATEQYWLCELFGRPAEAISVRASDDVDVDDDDTPERVRAYFARARSASDAAIADVDFDAEAVTWLGDSVSFRWAVLHVLEEAARHAGHADLIRQHLDGASGHLPDALLPY